MSTVYFNLSGSNFSQNWSNAGLLSVADNWDNVPSIVGYRGDEVTAVTGTDPRTLTANVTAQVVDVNVDQTNPSTFTTGGVTEFAIADPVVGLAGSGTADAPHLVIFLDATARRDITFSANVRDLDGSADDAQQQVAFQYRTSTTGLWTNVFYIADATSGPSLATLVTPVSFVLPADANNAATLEIRIITTNAAGNDEYIGIDDISVTSASVGPQPGSLSVANATIVEGNGGNNPQTITVTRSSGSAGPVSADYVIAFGTATADDFAAGQALTGTVTFADGQTTATIPFVISGDTAIESDETFTVTLSNPVGGATIGTASATVTLQNDDTPTAGTLSIAAAQGAEGNAGATPITFTVTRTGDSSQPTSVSFTVTAGTATAADFAGGVLPTGTVSFAAGETSRPLVVNIAGDTAFEPDETFTVTLSNPTNGAVTGTSVATGTIVNDDGTPIYVIQGQSHNSPLVGTTVTTSGIVIARDTTGDFGFWIQDAIGDGNAATSDGIFVKTAAAPTVAVGDSVSVTGGVAEVRGGGNTNNLPVTTINATAITVNSSGNALPAATLIGTGGVLPPNVIFDNDQFAVYDPQQDAADFYESLEGMRVQIDAPLVVAPTNSFGETFVVASGGAGATGVNARGGITISGDASNVDDYNPEKIQIDDDSGIFAGFTPAFTQGDRLSTVVGVVNYNFQNYEVLVTEAVSITTDAPIPSREITTLVGTTDRLSVATFNVENLDPGDGATKFTQLAGQIVTNLRSPDIIGVQEIQDADGAGSGANLSGQATANQLIAAITAAGGPTYAYVEIAPTTANTTGGEPNGNIRNGYFYNPARVQFVAGSADLVPGSAFSGSRSPLSADFAFSGQTVTLINMHSTSRGGSTPLFGAVQPQQIAGDTARTGQATAVRTYVDGLLAATPGANIIVLGDLNGFTYENAIEALTAGGVLTDANSLLPPEERYSFIFDSNSQALDHILLTPGLLATASYDAVHINAEQLATNRPTDHDPQLVTFRLAAGGNGGVVTTPGDDRVVNPATNDVIDGLAGFDTLDMGAFTGAITFNIVTGAMSSAQGGTDTITNFEQFILGSGNDVITGGGANRVILLGNNGNDALAGGSASDTLAGGEGNDTLAGGTGAANELIGGTGDDRYFVSAVGDSTLELPGEGTDTVFTNLPIFVLQSNVENLTANNNGTFLLVGNTLGNVITGGTGFDTISAGDGNDTLIGGPGAANEVIGGAGNDTYIIESIGDTIVEFAGEGLDSVRTALGSYVLRMHVENLTYTGPLASAFVGIGNEGDNVIAASNVNDFLSGLGGNDVLIGGSGNDEMFGGTGADQFRYTIAETGIDRIYDFTSGEDKIAFVASAFTNTGTIALVQGTGAFGATTASSTFLYQSDTGNLFYDGNGNAAGGIFLFAQLNPGLTLSVGDFLFI